MLTELDYIIFSFVHCSCYLSCLLACFYKLKPWLNCTRYKCKIFQRLKEEKSEPGQAVDEISGARNKRQVPVSLRTVCPGMHQSTSSTPPSNPCVKGRYYCPKYNVFEAVCKRVSLKCFSSICTIGFQNVVQFTKL